MRLQGKIALVTGGSRGIGRAACLAFAREGADVIVHYHREREAAEDVAAGVTAARGRATVVQADVADAVEVEQMAREVAGFLGDSGLHVLFNNAGIYPGASLEDVSVEEWDRVLAVDVRGPFLVTRALLPFLKRAGAANGARVINIGSVIPFLGTPGFIHYSTAKAALAGFTHSLARELAVYGITVNCVVPSMVATDTALAGHPGSEERILAQQAVQRFQQPEDLGGTLVFLASEDSALMTGQTLVVDGGRVLR